MQLLAFARNEFASAMPPLVNEGLPLHIVADFRRSTTSVDDDWPTRHGIESRKR